MKAVVFDWDGTLVDTLGALYRANEVVLGAFGLPFDEHLYRRHFAPDWRLMYRRLGIPDERLNEANELWISAFDGGREAQLFEGVREALSGLAASGYALGLVTAGDRHIVEPQLDRLGVADLLAVHVFGDDLPVHKPDPAPLRRALTAIGLADEPERTAYVGDVPDDMRMARAVGARGVGIASILGDPDALIAAGASEVADSVAGWSERLLRLSLD